MPDPVFERYKEALRAGHVAMLRGRLKEALERYTEAAALAEHRALPHASVGTVLLQLGRAKDALAAFDRALQQEPHNVAATAGRANALRALGRFNEDVGVRADAERFAAEPATAGIAPPLPADGDRLPPPTAALGERIAQAARMAAARGDREGERTGYVNAAAVFAQADRSDAALDACQRALAIDPGDPHVHVALARLYFDRGWQDRAVEKLVLLERLMAIEPRKGVHEQLVALAIDRAPGDPRVARLIGTVPAAPDGAQA